MSVCPGERSEKMYAPSLSTTALDEVLMPPVTMTPVDQP